MRKIFFLFVISALICLAALSSVDAQNKADSDERGWGLALGALLVPHPSFKYEATSIGDIKFPCRMYGSSLSAFFFGKKNLCGWRPFLQGEFGVSWLSGSGHKKLTLHGYPATAESNWEGICVRFGLIVNYLKMKRIWVGSGLEYSAPLIAGAFRDDFDMTLDRDGNDIEVFSPSSEGIYGSRGIILLSAEIFDNWWNSWEFQLGYWDAEILRWNSYGNYAHGGRAVVTEINGWYFQIKKLFLFRLRK